MNIKKDLLYKETHEWVKLSDDATALVGITDYAQSELGDIVFVNLPEVGDSFSAGDVIADIESVKAVSDIYSPVTGTVFEINEDLLSSPELINKEPYDAWLIKLKDVEAEDNFLTSEDYEATVG